MTENEAGAPGPATNAERLAWSMYDFANSGYTTVVLTTIFNAYFVATLTEGGLGSGRATFLWTLTIAVGNLIVLVSAPVVGAIADQNAWKKRALVITTIGCIAATTLLGFTGAGQVAPVIAIVIVSFVTFASSENLIAAFLPEISEPEHMGRLSGYGWGFGYFGGVVTLACCLAYITWAQRHGYPPAEFVPVTLWITAAIFALAATPTLLVLRERAVPSALPRRSYLAAGFTEVRATLREARRFQDLFRFLGAMAVFHAGVSTVIIVAAIYAQEVLGFGTDELVFLVMIVNVTAAVGAFGIGHLQDRLGSLPALALTLILWMVAIVLVLRAGNQGDLWLAANLIGIAMGASQSASRALIGRFTPVDRTAEFFGLWGLAARAAAIIGPVSYGLISLVTDGDQRTAVLSTLAFFGLGLVLLIGVDEKRGRDAAAQ